MIEHPALQEVPSPAGLDDREGAPYGAYFLMDMSAHDLRLYLDGWVRHTRGAGVVRWCRVRRPGGHTEVWYRPILMPMLDVNAAVCLAFRAGFLAGR